jgi:hypothetical protein
MAGKWGSWGLGIICTLGHILEACSTFEESSSKSREGIHEHSTRSVVREI